MIGNKIGFYLKLCIGLPILLALLEMPYMYYVGLRWWVFFFCVLHHFLLGLFFRGERFAVILTAVLFNPFFPFYLGREQWIYADIIVGLAFVVMALNNRFNQGHREIQKEDLSPLSLVKNAMDFSTTKS